MAKIRKGIGVILTWEPPTTAFWLTTDYLPHFMEVDRKLFPPWFHENADTSYVRPIPIPHDCTDGFLCAYWQRPEFYLNPGACRAISTLSTVGNFEAGLARLRNDLADGTWQRRYGHLLCMRELDLGYRLVVMN